MFAKLRPLLRYVLLIACGLRLVEGVAQSCPVPVSGPVKRYTFDARAGQAQSASVTPAENADTGQNGYAGDFADAYLDFAPVCLPPAPDQTKGIYAIVHTDNSDPNYWTNTSIYHWLTSGTSEPLPTVRATLQNSLSDASKLSSHFMAVCVRIPDGGSRVLWQTKLTATAGNTYAFQADVADLVADYGFATVTPSSGTYDAAWCPGVGEPEFELWVGPPGAEEQVAVVRAAAVLQGEYQALSSGPLRFQLRAHVGPTSYLSPTCSNAPASPTTLCLIGLDNIAIDARACCPNLAAPAVLSATYCGSTAPVAVKLQVTNPDNSLTYEWYSQNNPVDANFLTRGTSYSTQLSITTTYYVRAVRTVGSFTCASALTPAKATIVPATATRVRQYVFSKQNGFGLDLSSDNTGCGLSGYCQALSGPWWQSLAASYLPPPGPSSSQIKYGIVKNDLYGTASSGAGAGDGINKWLGTSTSSSTPEPLATIRTTLNSTLGPANNYLMAVCAQVPVDPAGNRVTAWQTNLNPTTGSTYTFRAEVFDLIANYGSLTSAGYDWTDWLPGVQRPGVELWAGPPGAEQLVPGAQYASGSGLLEGQYQATGSGTLCFQIRLHGDDTGLYFFGSSPTAATALCLVGLDNITIDEQAFCPAVPSPYPVISAVPTQLCGSGDVTITCTTTTQAALSSDYQFELYDQGSLFLTSPMGAASLVQVVTPPAPVTAPLSREYSVVIRGPSYQTPHVPVTVTWYPTVAPPAVQWQYPIGLLNHGISGQGTPPAGVTYTWTGPGLPAGGTVAPPYTPTVQPPAGTNTYTVTATGAGGCKSSTTLTLPVFALAVPASAQQCGLTALTLPPVGALPALPAGYDYRWYDPGYPPATGPTYSAPPSPGCRDISVCIVGPAGESMRLPIRVTWFEPPPNPLSAAAFSPLPVYKGLPVAFAGNQSTYTWNWGDAGSATNTDPPPHTYALPGTYVVTVTLAWVAANAACGVASLTCPPVSYTYSLAVKDALCETYLPGLDAGTSSAQVKLQQNARDGSFVFVADGPGCSTTAITWDCLSGLPPVADPRLAVAASAQSLQPARVVTGGSGWPSSTELRRNPYLSGAGYLRPEAGYTYSAPLNTDALSGPRLVKQAGRFTLLNPFAWGLSLRTRPRPWLAAGQATRHAPGGTPVEETDALGIRGAVRFGYAGRALPYITGKNADYDGLLFESFESESAPNVHEYEAGGSTSGVTREFAHGGQCSLALATLTARILPLPAPAALPASWRAQGVRIQVWVRVLRTGQAGKAAAADAWHDTPLAAQPVVDGAVLADAAVSLTQIAQSGEWTLCQAELPASVWTGSTGGIRLTWPAALPDAWLDDVRLQPARSQATAYVYDTQSLKLLASFDDQHFGLFYQYDPEGRLVRKQVETSQGIQTLQESQYNTPRSPRPHP